MKGRSTLILFISVIVLGGFIWLQEMWRARVLPVEYRRIKLFELDTSALSSIRFQHTNSVVECIKQDGVWMTGGPERGLGRADVASVHKLVANLNSMGKVTVITAQHLAMRGMKAADYGFNDPELEITAVDNKGQHHWLVGRHTPLDKMIYLKEAESDEIYTVSEALLEIVPGSPDALRDRTLFSGDFPGIRRVEIRGPGGFVQILKDSNNGWYLQQPVSAQADSSEVEKYIAQLYRLRVEEFIADNISNFAEYGLQGDDRQISLGGSGDISRMIVLGDEVVDRPGFIYARRADDTSVFMLNADVLELLKITAESFREVSVLSMESGTISSLVVTHGDIRLEMERNSDGRWMIQQPVVWEAEAETIESLFQTWNEAVVVNFNMPASSAAAEWTLEFGSFELGKTNAIHVLAETDEKTGLRIRRGKDSAVYQTNLQPLPDTTADPLHYKDRTVWQFDMSAVQKVSINKTGAAPQVVERNPDGIYSAAETNSGVRVITENVDKLLKRASNLRTSEYVTFNPRSMEIYGLAEPSLELHFSLTGTSQLGRVLLVGRETLDGFYSMVKGRDVVFLLDKITVDSFSVDLFEKPAVTGTTDE